MLKHARLQSGASVGVRQKGAIVMLWVDHPNYYGPDRRRGSALRLNERRRSNCAGDPPALDAALRQLRMHVIDAQGQGLEHFIMRLEGAALLAAHNGERQVSLELSALSAGLRESGLEDLRFEIYDALQRTHAGLCTLH